MGPEELVAHLISHHPASSSSSSAGLHAGWHKRERIASHIHTWGCASCRATPCECQTTFHWFIKTERQP